MADKEIGYRMHEMSVIEFSMSNIEPSKINNQSIRFQINADTKLNPEKSLLGVFVSVGLSKPPDTESLAFMKVSVGFEIKDFNENILKAENGKYVVPYKLDAATRRIAISTTRGVMFAYFKGTPLHNAIMPIVPELLKPEKK